MSYEEHTEDECDKCREVVGKENLIQVPFKYLDKNDVSHPDLGHGYRQYYCCPDCIKRGV